MLELCHFNGVFFSTLTMTWSYVRTCSAIGDVIIDAKKVKELMNYPGPPSLPSDHHHLRGQTGKPYGAVKDDCSSTTT